jgi:hypothetical protein
MLFGGSGEMIFQITANQKQEFPTPGRDSLFVLI